MAGADRIAAPPSLAGCAIGRASLLLPALFGLGLLSYVVPLALAGGAIPWWGEGRDPEAVLGLRHAAVISLVTALTVARRVAARPAFRETLAALEPILEGASALPRAIVFRQPGEARWVAVATLGALAGALVMIGSFGSFAETRASWDAHSNWALAMNLLLFAQMALLANEQLAADRYLDREVTPRLRVPLLEIDRLAAYARHGLRNALYWFVGSSVASLLFLNWGFSWTMVAVLACTFALGTLAVWLPVRALHARIADAKREALGRVRGEIEAARHAAVAGDGGAALRLPGLLAWETRVGRVPEWPFDVSTWLRFAALASLAVGSWLGGAVVERLLGVVVD